MTATVARGRTTVVAAGLVAGVAVTAVGGTACHSSPDAGRAIPGPLASALLAFAAERGVPPGEIVEAWHSIEGLAAQVAAHRRGPGEDVVDSLNSVIFGELAFAREVERVEPRFMVLPSVVADRRGSCVGLGALYLVLAERLGAPLAGVMVPGHFFVRATPTAGVRGRNIELLRRGEAMPDSWYVGKYGPWPPEASAYFRALAPVEVLAIHWFNLGNARRSEGDLPGAAAAYGRATVELPAFAEAWASLGAVRQAQGDLAGAARAYRAAAWAYPDLPGLAQNLFLLQNAAPPSPERTLP